MIRNLRSLLQAGLEPNLYLEKVFKAISDPKRVENGKIFPLQYINALSEMDKLIQSSLPKIVRKVKVIEEKYEKYARALSPKLSDFLPQKLIKQMEIEK